LYLTARVNTQRTTVNEAEIREVLQQIAKFKPTNSMHPVFAIQRTTNGLPTETGVAFSIDGNKGSLVVGQFSGADEQLQSKLQQLLAGRARFPESLRIETSRELSKTVNGRAASFTISEGEGEESHTSYRRILGKFRGEQGNAILILNAHRDALTDEQISDFVDSIK
jgi:hypothetical protein